MDIGVDSSNKTLLFPSSSCCYTVMFSAVKVGGEEQNRPQSGSHMPQTLLPRQERAQK